MSHNDRIVTSETMPGLFHRLLDWSIFPASVAAICTAGFGVLLGLLSMVTGRRTNTELIEAGVAVISAVIAGGASASTKIRK